MTRIYDFLESAGYYFFGTVDGENPCIRPFGSQLLHDGKLYMCTGDFKDVYQQMRQNPKVAVGAMGSAGDWMRLTGEAVFADNPELVDAMYEKIPSLRDIYEKQGRTPVIFYIQNGYAQFNSPDGTQDGYEF